MTAALHTTDQAAPADGVCAGCNGNRYYRIGDRIVWCATCLPHMALGQEKLKDCTSRHRDAAVIYWADKRRIGFVVTLAGKRHGKPATHDYHVHAGTIGGAIHTAKANDFILDGKAVCSGIRLACPCDCGSWK